VTKKGPQELKDSLMIPDLHHPAIEGLMMNSKLYKFIRTEANHETVYSEMITQDCVKYLVCLIALREISVSEIANSLVLMVKDLRMGRAYKWEPATCAILAAIGMNNYPDPFYTKVLTGYAQCGLAEFSFAGAVAQGSIERLATRR
jgi:hypothetical protein